MCQEKQFDIWNDESTCRFPQQDASVGVWCLENTKRLNLYDGTFTLPETNIAPENRLSQKESSLPTTSIFRCYVSFRESLGSGGSMVARLKLKGIDGRAPPGVEPAA